MKRWLLVAGAVLFPMLSWAAEPEVIGSVKTIQGRAEVIRDGASVVLRESIQLYRGDVLRTGPDGGLGLLLRDDTAISIGPNTEISLAEFAYDPAEGKLGLATKMTKGTLAYRSGRIAKLAPKAVRLDTPVATIGIRGTTFLAKVEEDR